jgi:hypothetical protein
VSAGLPAIGRFPPEDPVPFPRQLLAIAVVVLTPSLASAASAASPCTDTIITECSKEFPSTWGLAGSLLRAWCYTSGIDACNAG